MNTKYFDLKQKRVGYFCIVGFLAIVLAAILVPLITSNANAVAIGKAPSTKFVSNDGATNFMMKCYDFEGIQRDQREEKEWVVDWNSISWLSADDIDITKVSVNSTGFVLFECGHNDEDGNFVRSGYFEPYKSVDGEYKNMTIDDVKVKSKDASENLVEVELKVAEDPFDHISIGVDSESKDRGTIVGESGDISLPKGCRFLIDSTTITFSAEKFELKVYAKQNPGFLFYRWKDVNGATYREQDTGDVANGMVFNASFYEFDIQDVTVKTDDKSYFYMLKNGAEWSGLNNEFVLKFSKDPQIIRVSYTHPLDGDVANLVAYGCDNKPLYTYAFSVDKDPNNLVSWFDCATSSDDEGRLIGLTLYVKGQPAPDPDPKPEPEPQAEELSADTPSTGDVLPYAILGLIVAAGGAYIVTRKVKNH